MKIRWLVVGLLLSTLLLSCVTTGDDTQAPADFFLGTIWPNNLDADPSFTTYWAQVTPENGGKWRNAEPERDRMNWTDLDNAYAVAKDNEFPFRLHTLIWGRSHPLWLLALSPEEQIAETEEWFALVAERYPDIDFIDVVNEPLHEEIFNADVFGGWGTTGLDWVITMFELAREYFPDAVLQTNDYGILGSAALVGPYLRLVTALQDRGLIDAIGVQAHGLEDADPELIRANLDRLAETGLPIYVTELDVGRRDDDEQLAVMSELVLIFAGHPAVRGVTTWGYLENRTYNRSAYLLRADGTERPALTWLREFGDTKQ